MSMSVDPSSDAARCVAAAKAGSHSAIPAWRTRIAGGRAERRRCGKGAARDEIAMAGLDRAHVDQFEGLGFERSKVVRVSARVRSLPSGSCVLMCAPED